MSKMIVEPSVMVGKLVEVVADHGGGGSGSFKFLNLVWTVLGCLICREA